MPKQGLSRYFTYLKNSSDWLVFNSCDWCISILAVPVSCSLSRPLLRSSPVVGEDSGPLFRRRAEKKRTAERTTHRNSEDRNAQITAVASNGVKLYCL